MGNVNADRGLPGNLRWSACCQKRPSVAERCQRCVSRVYTCALASPELVRSRLQRRRYGRQRDTCALARPCKRDVASSDAHNMLLGSRHERARRVQRFRKMGVCLAGMGATPGATPQKEKVAVSAASPPSVDFSTEQVLVCLQFVAQSVMVSISTIATGSFAFAFAEQRPREAETECPAGVVECRDCAAVPGRLTLLCRLL